MEFTKNHKIHNTGAEEDLEGGPAAGGPAGQAGAEPERPPLQLQSILPVEHQRLVKYPLLLTEIKKQCVEAEDRDEWDLVTEATSCTKEILDSIDK